MTHLPTPGRDPLVHLFLIFFFVSSLVVANACAPRPKSPKEAFNPRTCMASVPKQVHGLAILEGPRSKASLIRDMVPAICNGEVLFQRLQAKDPELNPGRVVFKVAVESNGEVVAVSVEQSTIESHHFLKKVSNFIMDTDFVSWVPNDIDTVFTYPAGFGQ